MNVCRLGSNVFVGLLVTIVTLGARPVAAQVSAEQVRRSIEMGVDYLKGQQDKVNGNWTEHGGQLGGMTALCTLSLLTAGEDPRAPHMQAALNYLRNLPPLDATYAVALQTMVLAAAEPEKDRAIIARNARWLEQAQIVEGSDAGIWGYGSNSQRGDHSNAQFALLGLYEAEHVGVTIDPQVWQRSLQYFERTQRDDGSWAYYEQADQLPSTGSMTCAGLGSMLICLDRVGQGDAEILPDGTVRCCGLQTSDDRIERAVAWLGRHGLSTNPGMGSWYLYFMYGVERVGRLSGRRFLGEMDWYREGAQHLIARQDTLNGQVRGTGPIETNPIVGTAFALLFLAKGKRPVVISQLQWRPTGAADDWNRHPAALHNLTRLVEEKWRREMTWQTIRMKTASVDELMQSPVLFLRGTEALNLTDAEKKNLKEYIDQGGFILAEACDGEGCNGAAFDTSFRRLMSEMFPDSPLRELPPDHAIWFAEEKVRPQDLPEGMWLYGVDACCRTSVVYVNKTLSCYWEVSAGKRKARYNEAAARKVAACLALGQNILAYATNRELRDKLDQPDVRVRDEAETPLRGTLYIPKLSHTGGSDDAPNALPNLLQVMREQLEMRVNIRRQLLAPTDVELFDYPIIFMHGRRNFRFSPAERQAMAEYLERGGFVMADAICASPQFATAFRREFESLIPGATLRRLEPDHPLLSDIYRGANLRQVTLRDPQVRRDDDPLRATLSQITPVLEVLEVDGRIAVVFSPYDISCGLENQSSLECKGYVKADAARLAMNIVLFALGQ